MKSGPELATWATSAIDRLLCMASVNVELAAAELQLTQLRNSLQALLDGGASHEGMECPMEYLDTQQLCTLGNLMGVKRLVALYAAYGQLYVDMHGMQELFQRSGDNGGEAVILPGGVGDWCMCSCGRDFAARIMGSSLLHVVGSGEGFGWWGDGVFVAMQACLWSRCIWSSALVAHGLCVHVLAHMLIRA